MNEFDKQIETISGVITEGIVPVDGKAMTADNNGATINKSGEIVLSEDLRNAINKKKEERPIIRLEVMQYWRKDAIMIFEWMLDDAELEQQIQDFTDIQGGIGDLDMALEQIETELKCEEGDYIIKKSNGMCLSFKQTVFESAGLCV